MPSPKKYDRINMTEAAGHFLAALKRFDGFAQLGTKIARARTQDLPVVYAHVLPGLDLLICKVRGVQPPFPDDVMLGHACLESIANALEQAAVGLEEGGYWYESGGLGFLIFASQARQSILAEFGGSGPPLRTGAIFRDAR